MTLRERALALIGTWARPTDLPAKIALGIGIALLLATALGRGKSLLFGFEHADGSAPADLEAERVRHRRFVAIAALAAGLLSIAYVSSYLRGGPRIIDATTYFLQGRALSHGHLAWTPLDPSASFRGRFLFYREALAGGESSLAGIFPPGYPLLLSFGFMLGAPMIVGPLLAMGLVAATYELTRALTDDESPRLAVPAARAAALLSIGCAALRYHTADTMSHGASALCVTIALASAIRARRTRLRETRLPAHRGPTRPEDRSPFDRGRLQAAIAGLATGYVVATRPVSAVPIALVVAWLLRPSPSTTAGSPRSRLLVLAIAGLVPGIFLLLLSQRVATGSWFTSTQRLYYATSDGPPGCFRLGFGKGIGCLYEHGDFVEARLKDGYGLAAAAGTTLRRLHKHLLDVANFEPLALLVFVPALLRKRNVSGAVLPATVLVLFQMLVYFPFYFDGDYPGGGARFFADILPVEHALVMTGAAMFVSRSATDAGALEQRFVRAGMFVLALAMVGFAIHASHDHVALRDRDGGRPMFEPDVLANASLKSGLVFVDTDHGFGLGHDPSARLPNGVVVARLRSDDRDRMLYESLGRPPTYLYKFDRPTVPPKEATPTLAPWTPPESAGQRRFEAEAEWPPLSQEGGFAVPVWAEGCASGKRALVVTPVPPEPGKRARATIALPVPSAGRWAVEVRTADNARLRQTGTASSSGANGAGGAEGAVSIDDARWTWQPHDTCTVLPAKELELHPPSATVTIEASGGPIGLDSITLRKAR